MLLPLFSLYFFTYVYLILPSKSSSSLPFSLNIFLIFLALLYSRCDLWINKPTSLGSLLEMQNPGLPPRPSESESAFSQDPQVFACKWTFKTSSSAHSDLSFISHFHSSSCLYFYQIKLISFSWVCLVSSLRIQAS